VGLWCILQMKSKTEKRWETRRSTHTLNKRRHDFTPRLQERMARHYAQELLQPLPPMLNHVVAEAVRKDLARQRRDRHARRLALQHVPEVLEVGVAAADGRLLEFEGGDVGHDVDLVVGVHVSAGSMCSRVADLFALLLAFCTTGKATKIERGGEGHRSEPSKRKRGSGQLPQSRAGSRAGRISLHSSAVALRAAWPCWRGGGLWNVRRRSKLWDPGRTCGSDASRFVNLDNFVHQVGLGARVRSISRLQGKLLAQLRFLVEGRRRGLGGSPLYHRRGWQPCLPALVLPC
jgi:hypothetical protein